MHGLLSCAAVRADPPKFELRDGDRVVMLGGTFFEREVRGGYLETALTSSVPRVNVTFRNLGWSGDTVWADSREIFEPPPVGYQRMLELVRELKPTVLFLAYGAQESLSREAGLPQFMEQYEKLLDDLDQISLAVIAPEEFRYVFFTPHQFETPPAPLPDASRHDPTLAKYAQAIRELAERRKGWLVDLFDRTQQVTLNQAGSASPAITGPDPPRGFQEVNGVWKSLPLTDNGMHLSKYGYLRVSRILLQTLKLPHAEFLLQLDSEGGAESDVQTVHSDFHRDGQQLRFKMKLTRLPEPPTPLFPRDVEYFVIAGGGLPSGHYALKIDGQIASVNPTMLVGFPIRAGADYEQAEALRKKIVAKNRLFFRRWRDDNEQKLSAAEIAQPDPLVEKAEAEIAELKQPKTHQYEIAPREEEKK